VVSQEGVEMSRSNGDILSGSSCIATAMRKASRRLSQLYDDFLAPEGLKITQFAILTEVERRAKRPPTVRELAAVLVMDRSALGHTLRPLERDGLLAFGEDETDRRRRPVILTAEGDAALARAKPLWKQAQARFAKIYGVKAMAALRGTLHEIAYDENLATAGAAEGGEKPDSSSSSHQSSVRRKI
jgi:DNA-binding MarR family transcriptional regulator